ncbi:NAD(P)/FAD-dependent oxidoreductase [Methylobacterium sp. Leaf100]|uniref:NAD(P)/FAD-dependent oxidoreductase n=1 Tax=Methylobacterium sp. Leaf100 TaxID=1736252 RepID=UPI0006F93A9E|nr:NAD(P)/FAD-dependent oxidoreductase [Methylobacterium sp. Leaf100]KQP28890.1 pyridine nucleotide-disulfide oxidoreductase [Methylobacterium sp. Leaf100]
MHDAIIVGGGPAGLNAALILGRCRRSVLLIDCGDPRNAATPRTWGLFTRDGTPPAALRAQGRADLARYPTVECRTAEVTAARREGDAFAVVLADGQTETARRLVLATGLHQDLPTVEGFDTYWTRGVHTCPYCDGYESRDQPLVAYGHGHAGVGLALELTVWSRDVTLCTDDRADSLSEADRARLDRHGIGVADGAVARLAGNGEQAERLVFADGTERPCHAVFLTPGGCRPSDLITQLGCDLTPKGIVPTGDYEGTNVPGLYVAGDASRRVQFAVVAAAEGAMAAFAINTELLKDDAA